MSYGTAAGVAALTPRYASSAGTFDTSTTPTLAQVDSWRSQLSGMLDVALSARAIPLPISNASVLAMLDAVVNGHAAAMVRGVNGQGRFAERPVTADEMWFLIGGQIDEWATAAATGIGALLGLDAEDVARAPVVSVGSFTRADGYTAAATEYTR